MASQGQDLPAYVVKAADIPALYYLDSSHPRPILVEWVNRGTDQLLRPTTVDMLLRTMFRESSSPSVRKLHETAGLRTCFRNERDRDRFAAIFAAARKELDQTHDAVLTAVYDSQDQASAKIFELKEAGVPEKAISLVWRASHYLDPEYEASEGHSVPEVAGSMVGGGLAGALLGVGVLFVPGVGPVAVAGALTASAFGSIAALSGIIGATGGALAKMLSDHDVDGVAAGQFQQEIRRGKVFISVDTRQAEGTESIAADILSRKAPWLRAKA